MAIILTAGSKSLKCLNGLESFRHWHENVGEDDVATLLTIRAEADLAVGGLVHIVSRSAQHRSDQPTKQRVIIDQQNPTTAHADTGESDRNASGLNTAFPYDVADRRAGARRLAGHMFSFTMATAGATASDGSVIAMTASAKARVCCSSFSNLTSAAAAAAAAAVANVTAVFAAAFADAAVAAAAAIANALSTSKASLRTAKSATVSSIWPSFAMALTISTPVAAPSGRASSSGIGGPSVEHVIPLPLFLLFVNAHQFGGSAGKGRPVGGSTGRPALR